MTCKFLNLLQWHFALVEPVGNDTHSDASWVESFVRKQVTQRLNHRFTAPRLYRARNHNHVDGTINDGRFSAFINESEFWNAPDGIPPLGRCNAQGESLLYCSNSWENAILETRPVKDCYISVSVYQAKTDPQTNEFFGSRINPVGVQFLSKIESLIKNEMFKDYDFTNRKDEFYELDNYLDELFHKVVSADESLLYKLSIAVKKCMIKNLSDGGIERNAWNDVSEYGNEQIKL